MVRSLLALIFTSSVPAFTASPLLTYTSLTVPLMSAVGYGLQCLRIAGLGLCFRGGNVGGSMV